MDRHTGSHPSVHPYQHNVTRRASRTWDNIGQLHAVESLVDLPPVASSSQTMFEDPESVTSPGTDSDTYHSLPYTTASARWAPFEGLDWDPQVRIRGMRF